MAVKYERKKTQVISQPQESGRLPGRPWPPFIYAHHPQAWEVVDGEWLPVLKPIFAVPGVNGCKVLRTKQPDGSIRTQVIASTMKADMEQKGWRFLDERAPVLVSRDGELVEEAGYLDEIEGDRGTFYCSVWWTPEVQGYGRRAQAVKGDFDQAGYDATRRRLVEQGAIPPVDPRIVGRKLDRQQDRAARSAKLAHDGSAPGLKARADREAARLEEVEAASESKVPKKRKPATRRKRSTRSTAKED